jgi:hypothetical protein
VSVGFRCGWPNAGEVIKKRFQGIAAFKVVDQRLHGHTGFCKDGGSAQAVRRCRDQRFGNCHCWESLSHLCHLVEFRHPATGVQPSVAGHRTPETARDPGVYRHSKDPAGGACKRGRSGAELRNEIGTVSLLIVRSQQWRCKGGRAR